MVSFQLINLLSLTIYICYCKFHFSDDGHSFDQCLFYGNESALIIFDTLLFCIIDLICQNYVLAGVITYIIIEVCINKEVFASGGWGLVMYKQW